MYIHNTNVVESHDNNADVHSRKTQNIKRGCLQKKLNDWCFYLNFIAHKGILLDCVLKGIFMITPMMERDRKTAAE